MYIYVWQGVRALDRHGVPRKHVVPRDMHLVIAPDCTVAREMARLSEWEEPDHVYHLVNECKPKHFRLGPLVQQVGASTAVEEEMSRYKTLFLFENAIVVAESADQIIHGNARLIDSWDITDVLPSKPWAKMYGRVV